MARLAAATAASLAAAEIEQTEQFSIFAAHTNTQGGRGSCRK